MVALNITTGQIEYLNYLAVVNTSPGTSMTTSDLANLILLHEFRHLRGEPQESGFCQFIRDVYDDCITP